jgi:hypothetical protein
VIALSPVPIHGLLVAVNRERVVRLEGVVPSEIERQNAERLAHVPGASRIDNRLQIDALVASMPLQRTVLSPELAAEIELNHLNVVRSTEMDFNDDIGTTNTARATDEAEPYFPPTDPPIRRAPNSQQGIEVVGGFAPTSLDAPIDLEQLPTALLRGDDEIAREVNLALSEDAATGDLEIRVIVHNGIVFLHGTVPTLTDADSAEDVASRVPNVVEVREELDVEGL